MAVPRARRDPSRLPAVRLFPPALSPHSGLPIGQAGETPAAGPAGSEHTPTASRRRPIAPEGRRPRARNVSVGPARSASTLSGSRPPPGGANRHRRRTYRGWEGGRERLTVLTPFKKQTTALEGTASPHPPARSASAHARAGPAPRARGRARGARWEREFSSRFPGGRSSRYSPTGSGGQGFEPPPVAASPPVHSTPDPSPSQQLHSNRCAGP